MVRENVLGDVCLAGVDDAAHAQVVRHPQDLLNGIGGQGNLIGIKAGHDGVQVLLPGCNSHGQVA